MRKTHSLLSETRKLNQNLSLEMFHHVSVKIHYGAEGNTCNIDYLKMFFCFFFAVMF